MAEEVKKQGDQGTMSRWQLVGPGGDLAEADARLLALNEENEIEGPGLTGGC